MKIITWKSEFGHVMLPERRKIKPEGEYTHLPLGDIELWDFKYTILDFIKDVIRDCLSTQPKKR